MLERGCAKREWREPDVLAWSIYRESNSSDRRFSSGLWMCETNCPLCQAKEGVGGRKAGVDPVRGLNGARRGFTAGQDSFSGHTAGP